MHTKTTPAMEEIEQEQPPWFRLPGEPIHWFTRFQAYVEQEPPRSVLRVYRAELERKGEKRCGKKPISDIQTIPHSWSVAKTQWQWIERGFAYDQAKIRALREMRSAQRKAQAENELAAADQLWKKGAALLTLPHITVKEEKQDTDGTKVMIMEAVNSEYLRVAVAIFERASMLGRRACGMPTISKELDINTLSEQDLCNIILERMDLDPIRASAHPALGARRAALQSSPDDFDDPDKNP